MLSILQPTKRKRKKKNYRANGGIQIQYILQQTDLFLWVKKYTVNIQ